MAKQIFNRTIAVDGVDIFYREAGDPTNPALLLLHGFPSSSVMFKALMSALSDQYYLVAPDYPGFGFSAFPGKEQFEYTFRNIASCINKFTDAIHLKRFTIYLHDYGCVVGLHICVEYPEKIERLIVQNGNAYEEGIGEQWKETIDYWENPTPEKKAKVYAFVSEEGVRWQYTAGVPEDQLPRVSPELWIVDWEPMKRPGNVDMQIELNCDYASHIRMFPAYHEYFRKYQPPTLVIWGKHDPFFDMEAYCYQRDLPQAQVHLIDGSHWILETHFDELLVLINGFLH